MRVVILHEAIHQHDWGGYRLCLQWCRYTLDDGEELMGYRYIWRGPKDRMSDKKKGPLLPTRGQARIPSFSVMAELMEEAKKRGWGYFDADDEEIEWEDKNGVLQSTVIPGHEVRAEAAKQRMAVELFHREREGLSAEELFVEQEDNVAAMSLDGANELGMVKVDRPMFKRTKPVDETEEAIREGVAAAMRKLKGKREK